LTLPVEVQADQPARMQPDLHGLHCLVTESAILDMTGVSEYLTHAGARVHRVADAADATRIVAGLPAPVVALCDASQTHHGQPAAFAEAPNVRQLLISRGRRRQARVEVPDIVCLDGTALRRQALLRAVAITAGRASPEIVHESGVEEQSDGAPPMSVAEARDRGQLILVAEDDEVNRRVITTQLELLGRTAEIACDGAEALNMWRDGRYALLLTDLHMPQMDGYALTKAIRLLEAERSRQTPGDRRMPIIALTANALRGEAERAKAVGMDDYLTKPLQLDHLRNVIERYMPVDGSGAATSPSVPQVSVPPEVTLDVAVLRNLVGRRPGKVREFLARYRTAAQRDRIDLHAACNAGNAKEAAAIAHKLKSSSRTVGALRLGELCAEIEQAGHAGDLAAVRQQLACFQTTIDEVSAKIESLLADERT
jgi:CheY-like chemotaxis protein/HPt (histidine-containing phosphotransfer) domain-containing protein